MIYSRSLRLKYTTISSIVSQLVAVVCGFILPRLIIGTYGSDQNGLVQSISQFLSVITFLDLGVGTVVQSSLYKPIADNDKSEISKIYISAQKFFRHLAMMLAVYLILLICFYPYISSSKFDFWYTAAMVTVLGYGLFAQYYFGIVNSLLITADQRGYISYNLQSVTVMINMLLSCVMIYSGASLLMLRFVTSFVFLVRPVFLYYYVHYKYDIDYKIKYTIEPIKQKWNGIAMHISAVILDNTDVVVLTIFSTLSNVSIYSIYNIIILGVKSMFFSATTGIRSLIGDMLAKGEEDKLRELFSWVEWIIHTGTILVFGITGLLILPFIRVYMDGVTDANYVQPLFATLIVAAHCAHCLRLPYNTMILAGGHYKQTQSNYIIASLLNLGLSILVVKFYGLIGVAVGTLVAMLFQTIWMSWYNSKNFIHWPVKFIIKQFFVDAMVLIFMYLSSLIYHMSHFDIPSWIVLSIEICFTSLLISVIINCLFYREKMNVLKNKLVLRICRK